MNPNPGEIGRYRNSARQFVMFGIVGGSGLVVNMVITVLMNRANGGTQNAQDILFPFSGTEYNLRFTTLVWIVAFLVANVYNFMLNRHWTFGKGHKAPVLQEFWPFLLVGSVAAVAGIFIKLAFTNPTSPLYLPEPWWHEDAGIHSREYWSQLLTIIITMPINFVVNKLWTFRSVRRRHHARSTADAVV
ncbi:GtrA family protein [Dietzia psychralcaliphila]|uniref:GtrA family protein n=1 Tax=Dietzia psychralcaliphila TaxID=139021 RepID=UPI0027DF50C5|nr:GtrA family protein [Dietzia psychralcaliphila]